jgi:hypothetical protein
VGRLKVDRVELDGLIEGGWMSTAGSTVGLLVLKRAALGEQRSERLIEGLFNCFHVHLDEHRVRRKKVMVVRVVVVV